MVSYYYIIRAFTPLFYTIEFIISFGVFLVLLLLYIKGIEKKSLTVFLLTGTINTLIEIILQTISLRIIENAYFFFIPIGFPWICFIMGFFDGGVKNLFAYHMVKIFKDHNMLSKYINILLFATVFIIFLVYNIYISNVLNVNGVNITITQRNIFNISSILLLILSFSISIYYFFFSKNVLKEERKIFFQYALGLIVFLISWIFSSHILMTRYVAINGITPAPICEQILLLWVYSLLVEIVGVSIFIVVLLHKLKFFEKDHD